MKLELLSIALTLASAKWGIWNRNKYCDYEMELIDRFETTPPIGSYNEIDCQLWCKQRTREEFVDLFWGTDLCCDFEAWSYGKYTCSLYLGSNI